MEHFEILQNAFLEHFEVSLSEIEEENSTI